MKEKYFNHWGVFMKRWLLAAVLVAGIAAFAHEPGFAVSIQKPDQVMTVQQSVVDFPGIGQVTIKALRSWDGFAAFTFSDARGNLLYKRVESESDLEFSRQDAGYRSSTENFATRVGFRVVDGPTAGSKMVFLATGSRTTSNSGYTGTLVAVHEGAFRVLQLQGKYDDFVKKDDLGRAVVFVFSQGGMYVGDLGEKRGFGFAAWNIIWNVANGERYSDPHRYAVRLYRVDQEAGQMVKIADLKTKNKYDDTRKALKELGLDYPNILQTIPVLRCYFLGGNWRCDERSQH